MSIVGKQIKVWVYHEDKALAKVVEVLDKVICVSDFIEGPKPTTMGSYRDRRSVKRSVTKYLVTDKGSETFMILPKDVIKVF